jgi:M6 family metalloprotease-like protein
MIEGTYPVPVLLGEYSNSTGTHTAEEFQALLFDGPNPTGTMKEYYEENSYGSFTVDGIVHGWYELPEPDSFYVGIDYGMGPWPNNAGRLVYDLASASDAAVDYSIYDNDGPDGIPNSGDDDGYVDQFFAVHTGTGAECTQGMEPAIWSHSASIYWIGGPFGGYVTDDSSASGGFIRIDRYIIMPQYSCHEDNLIEIGVFCHEFGHSIGLPDLYDRDMSSAGIGAWGLMSYGAWGGDMSHPDLPVYMCAWSKEKLGWIEPIEVTSNTGVVMLPRVEDSPVVVKVWEDGDYSGEEYFLIENRQQVGFDESLPIPGVMIWHIDNRLDHNDDENHKLVDVEAADGQNDLDRLTNWGDVGDPWPGITKNRSFCWHTNPNSNSYNGFSFSEVMINEIGDPDSVVELRLTVNTAEIDSIKWDIEETWTDGDDDGLWDAGETVELDILVYNGSEEPAESLWAVITCEDSTIWVLTSSVYLGTLEGNSQIGNADNPLVLHALPEAGVRRTELQLALLGANDFRWETTFTVLVGHPALLVVDDSELGSGIFEYYSTTLDSLSIPFVTRIVHSQGSPADSLHPFARIIWFTGQESEEILDSLDLVGLREHLADGGQLLLTGQNIAEDLHNREESFLGDVLRVDWGGTGTLPFAYGLRGDPVTDSIEMILSSGSGGANNQTSRDILLVQSGADPIAVYDTTNLAEAAAVRIDNPVDQSRIVFLGFGFEAVNSTSDLYATRVEFMSLMLRWLEGMPGIQDGQDQDMLVGLPKAFKLGQNYPNPFNPSTTISFNIDRTTRTKQPVSLIVYDIRGRRVRTLVDSKLEPGRHTIHWDGRNDRGQSISSGIYLYTLNTGGEMLTRKMTVLK